MRRDTRRPSRERERGRERSNHRRRLVPRVKSVARGTREPRGRRDSAKDQMMRPGVKCQQPLNASDVERRFSRRAQGRPRAAKGSGDDARAASEAGADRGRYACRGGREETRVLLTDVSVEGRGGREEAHRRGSLSRAHSPEERPLLSSRSHVGTSSRDRVTHPAVIYSQTMSGRATDDTPLRRTNGHLCPRIWLSIAIDIAPVEASPPGFRRRRDSREKYDFYALWRLWNRVRVTAVEFRTAPDAESSRSSMYRTASDRNSRKHESSRHSKWNDQDGAANQISPSLLGKLPCLSFSLCYLDRHVNKNKINKSCP